MLRPTDVLEYLNEINDSREIVNYLKNKLDKYLSENSSLTRIQETIFQISIFVDLKPVQERMYERFKSIV